MDSVASLESTFNHSTGSYYLLECLIFLFSL
jgi:hypothetical protein